MADDKKKNIGSSTDGVTFEPLLSGNVSGVTLPPSRPPDEDGDLLLHCYYECLDVRDFHAEVRALRDVELALSNAVVLLDAHIGSLSEIVQAMLDKLVTSQTESDLDIAAIRRSIFTSENSENVVTRSIQGSAPSVDMGGVDYDQSWLCIMCEIPDLSQRRVAFARLHRPVNLGPTCQEAQFVILIVSPSRQKVTKSIVETGRTISSLFTEVAFRHKLLVAPNAVAFRRLLQARADQMAKEQGDPTIRKSTYQLTASIFDESGAERSICGNIGRGLWGDLKRRLPHYLSDYRDGFVGNKTLQKVSGAIFFLYFACVLPNLAFGMLNSNNTKGAIGVKKILFSQTLGGVIFALFGGQPLIVLLTTAPLALYTKIIFNISEDFDIDFYAMFSCVGLWNAFFLLIYSLFGVSRLMKWSSRSTEEIFSIFISVAFFYDAIKDCVIEFTKNYNNKACEKKSPTTNSTSAANTATTTVTAFVNTSGLFANQSLIVEEEVCRRENSILFLFLMLCTVWIGLTLFNFTKTPYLTAGKREMLADYSLPLAVLTASFLGSFVFNEIELEPFEYNPDESMFKLSSIGSLSPYAILASAGMGFSLSLLFFMDQNISSALVNTPNNMLKKGAAYHWDLLVVALINTFLSLFGFPWVHAALPHSPLHVRALADMEERVEQGHVHQIVAHVRETRVSGLVSHIMIGLSVLLLPIPLVYIPRPVLDGLFLYVAVTALYGNQLYDRVLLLFTEQTAYPPNHYIRRVPQRKIHKFTSIQLVQLAVLCVVGFNPFPYLKLIFPVLLMFLMPIRHMLMPKLIEKKYLKALDGH